MEKGIGTKARRRVRAPGAYAAKALERAVGEVRGAGEGTRNDTLNRAAVGVFALSAAGLIGAEEVEQALRAAGLEAGLEEREVAATLRSARRAGEASPADVEVEPPSAPRPSPASWRITVWPSMTRPAEGREHAVTWDTLVGRLRSPATPPATAKADLPVWNCGEFREGRRSAETFERAHALMLDYDALPDLDAEQIRAAWRRWAFLAHTSSSHRPEAPKWRVILPLSRPATAEEYPRLWDWSQTVLPGADQTTRQAYRGWYVPVARPGYEAFAHRDGGAVLDVDRILALPPDARAVVPQIVVNGRQLLAVITDAWQAIRGQNAPPAGPVLFAREGALVRLRRLDSDGPPALHDLGVDEAYGLLLRSARWVKLSAGKEGGEPEVHDTTPPKDAARDLLAYPDPTLLLIESVVASPVIGRGGEVIERPGYHPDDRLWLHRRPGFRLPAVPRAPTLAEVQAATALLLDDLLVDFPFAGEADRAHALAALLTPLVRRVISGPTPLHLISAPTPGSGKGLLAAVVGVLATGIAPEVKPVSCEDEEVRKMLLAELLRGQPVILLDNADERRVLRSAALAAALTSEAYTDRILGSSRIVSAANRATWILTGNNPRMSLELARRCVRVRLVPAEDRPWLRSGFKHDPLLPWVREHRPELLAALLTLVRAWQAQGSPAGTVRLGSFEAWSEVVGGILAAAGVPGFLANLVEFYEEADVAHAEWLAFVEAWRLHLGPGRQTVPHLVELAGRIDILGDVLGDGTSRSQATRLGQALHRQVGRVFGDIAIHAGHDRTKRRQYWIGPPGQAEPPPEPGPEPPAEAQQRAWWS